MAELGEAELPQALKVFSQAFRFKSVPGDPFKPQDTGEGAKQYARELGGASPGAEGLARAVQGATTVARSLSSPGEIARVWGPEVVNSLLVEPGKEVVGALDTLGNALMGNRLVVQAPDGPIDVTREELAGAGTTLAGTIGLSSVGVPKPVGALSTFGGMNAKTADLDKLGDAMRMWERAVPPEEIWSKTGWAKGHDGKWRFEISDHAMRLNVDAIGKLEEGWGHKLGNVMEHNKLFEAYPSLAKIHVEKETRPDLGGMYHPVENIISAKAEGSGFASPQEIILHEIQHAIQSREGFAAGGSPKEPEAKEIGEEVLRSLVAKRDVLKEKISQGPITDENDVSTYAWLTRTIGKMQAAPPGQVGYEVMSGEVEARNVERRFKDVLGGLAPPWMTEDLPRIIQRNRWVPEWSRRVDE